ncbi:8090_t:CDS:2, partial [Gigaspora rosea]
MLDRIDSNAISEEGHNWKQSAKTKATYSKLFSLIVANNPEDTYISHIFTKVFPKEEVEENLMAFGIDTQDQPTPTFEDKDQAAVSETAGVPEISNVQSKDAPETTQVQEETKKSGTS